MAAEMRRLLAVRLDAARGSRTREGEPRAGTCVAGAGKRAESVPPGRGAPGPRAARRVAAAAIPPEPGRKRAPGLGPRPPGTSHLPAPSDERRAGKRVPEDLPRPRGASGAAVQGPRMEGGPRRRWEAAAGSRARARMPGVGARSGWGRRRAPQVGAATPLRGLCGRGERALPPAGQVGVRRGAALFWRGVEGASRVEPGLQTRSPVGPGLVL